jgi:hypothetical protein
MNPGAPTTDRIAKRLSDISPALDQAVPSGALVNIASCVAELGRLRMAREAWEDQRKGQQAAGEERCW